MQNSILKSAVFVVCSLMFLWVQTGLTAAQSPRRSRTRPAPAKPAPQPAPTPTPAPAETRSPKQPVKLALLNGQVITTADIDPEIAAQVEDLDERVAETTQRVFDMAVNTLVLENEARKRRLNSQQLYDTEVTRRIAEPSPTEVTRLIEENRAQLGGADAASARTQVVTLLKSQREAQLSEELVRRLRSVVPITMGADFSRPNLAPATVIATVGGVSLTYREFSERLKPIVYELRLATYELAQEALNRTITDLLLIAEATRRKVPPEEIVRSEITSKLRPPTEAEVAKFYADNKSQIQGDLESVKNQVASYLQEQEQQRLEELLAKQLRQGADLKILISEPVAPHQSISVDDDPAEGPATAPVTIVAFTDFQCPACAAMHPVIGEVLKSYEARVKYVVRDFPLRIHPNAFKAAEAANSAYAQGKFFEFANLLYQRQNALDVASLKKYATELGLDRMRFDAALDKGMYAAEIRNDMKDGELYGVDSTPTIFVNGIRLRSLSAEALRGAIDRALATPPQTTTP